MAGFTQWNELELPAAFDAHVHLRDGEMARLVTPTIRKGGVDTVYVMVSYLFFYRLFLLPALLFFSLSCFLGNSSAVSRIFLDPCALFFLAMFGSVLSCLAKRGRNGERWRREYSSTSSLLLHAWRRGIQPSRMHAVYLFFFPVLVLRAADPSFPVPLLQDMPKKNV